MAYSEKLKDSIGNIHERKNKYLLDLVNSDGNRSELTQSRDKHPYIIKLNEIESKEKYFLDALKNELMNLKFTTSDKKISNLEKRLFIAEKKRDFYKDYVDDSYDFEFEYKKSLDEIKHIPEIISNDKKLNEEIIDCEIKLKSVDEDKRQVVLEEIKKKTEDRKKILDDQIRDLKEKESEGLISKKALNTEIKISKRSAEEDISALAYIDEKKSYEEDIKNLKHHIKMDYESMMNVMEADISDLRRRTPIEIEKNKAIISFLTIPLPGLGQLLNKQYVKAILFFIASLFIYLVAIPYALGYGNYRGDGIQGLITLAKGGKKLDKSIIFMIEGIIAIVLLFISLLIYYFSFRDVYNTEKGAIQGIRPKTWYESKKTIENEGYPLLVSSPAAIAVLFIVLVPIMTTILISFTNYSPKYQSKFTWAGLQNYNLLISGKGVAGKAFWPIVEWTFIWTIGATTLAIAIGFILALLANQDRIKFKGIFRTIYLLPWAVPAFITIMFFSQMVAPNGPITNILQSIFGGRIDIKNNTTQTRLFLIALQGWLGSAYVFLLSTGILQGIPEELYEAAEIDGATGLQRTTKITIPLVLFQTAPLLIGQYTFNFNNFSIIHLFNGGGPFDPTVYGNVAGSSDLLISYIYKLTITNNYQGLGAAVTIIISIGLMFFSWLGFRNTKAFKED